MGSEALSVDDAADHPTGGPAEHGEGENIAGILRNGRSLANIKQLLQGEADSQEQGVDLEAVERPAEVRSDKDPPLLSVERALPRYSADRVHLRHASFLPVQQWAPDYGRACSVVYGGRCQVSCLA